MLKVKGVSAGYNGTKVLHDISFELERGETLAVIGPNGCGKTTLLRAAANLIPFEGEVLVDGRDVRGLSRRQTAEKIAMLFQSTSINFEYTVYETVMMGRYARMARAFFPRVAEADKEAALTALDAVHMSALRDSGLGTLSGGQLQRVFLAKTLAQQPDIIMLDEPANHLDLSYQVELAGLLRDWAAGKGLTIIGVMHDINLAMHFSEKFLVLKEGRVEVLGPAGAALGGERLKSVYGMDVAGYMRETLRKWENIG
ncbi:MAG: ABC transporter ATP-binding protein [Clostridiales bacterium]|nr:ABC transporter ATP-binding protein [Clostridiales bacterium]